MRLLALIIASLSFVAMPSPAQTVKRSYQVVHGWPQLPDNEMLDEVSAVAVDQGGEVFVLTRAGRKWPDSGELDTSAIPKPTILIFDGRTGHLIERLGAGLFALPHSITIDASNAIWVADVALHQVFKLSRDGKLLLSLGERAKPGEDQRHFNRPSDVAIAPDGSIFVSDGYGNNRIVKFDSTGRFQRQWGTKGSRPGQFQLPHSLTIDAQRRVWIVDRGNARVQAFDLDGGFLFEWRGPPFVSPQSIDVAADGHVFVVELGNEPPPDEAGVWVLNREGMSVERIGRFGNYDGQFVDPHWLALDRHGNIYVADFGGRRVQKFKPKERP